MKQNDLLDKVFLEIQENFNQTFTEEFCKVLKEAIISGDFMSHVTKPSVVFNSHENSVNFERSVGVTYMPYRENILLQERIRNLEKIIDQVEHSMRIYEEDFEYCDFIEIIEKNNYEQK